MKMINDLPYRLALVSAPHIGHKTFLRIINMFQSLADFFALKEADYEALKLRPETIAYLRHPDWKEIEANINWSQSSPNHAILSIEQHAYPSLLREIHDPPPLLFVRGIVDFLATPQIAIIGSRKPTPTGKEIAFSLAADLASQRLTITSGLALGIDTAAHQGALRHRQTIAVLGTGINRYYPHANRKLAESIAENGVLVSEFPLNTPPLAKHFPRRNRLISGLSLGTLVVEATKRSGSLITAEYALDQGREVFAVPGSLRNPLASGCHWLLKQGATLVETVDDILEALGVSVVNPRPQAINRTSPVKNTLDGNHLKLLECLDDEPASIDILAVRSNFEIPIITSLIMDLELAGYICSSLNGYRRVT